MKRKEKHEHFVTLRMIERKHPSAEIQTILSDLCSKLLLLFRVIDLQPTRPIKQHSQCPTSAFRIRCIRARTYIAEDDPVALKETCPLEFDTSYRYTYTHRSFSSEFEISPNGCSAGRETSK